MLDLKNIAHFLFVISFGLSIFAVDVEKEFLDACANRKLKTISDTLSNCQQDEACLSLLLNAKDTNNRGPLHMVIRPPLGTVTHENEGEEQKVIEIISTLALYSKYFSPDTKSNGGFAPLHTACMLGKHAIIKALLENFIDISLDIQDNELNVPLHYALESENPLEILEIFLKTNKEFGLTEQNNYSTPLEQIMGHSKEIELFQLLIDYKLGFTKINEITIYEIIQKKIKELCSLLGKCPQNALMPPEQFTKETKNFFSNILLKDKYSITNESDYYESMLYSVRSFNTNDLKKILSTEKCYMSNNKVEKYYDPMKISPDLLQSLATEALEYGNIDMFIFLLGRGIDKITDTLPKIFKLDKCTPYTLEGIIRYFKQKGEECNSEYFKNILSFIFIEVWQHGDPIKFKVVLNELLSSNIDYIKNMLDNVHSNLFNTQRDYYEVKMKSNIEHYLNLLIEQIKLDHEAKNKAIVAMVFNQISEEQRTSLLDRLPLPYLVPYKFYNIIGSRISSDNINNTDDNGYTMLHRAIIHNDILLIEYLLSQGAASHINDWDDLVWRFSIAIQKNHTDVVDKLISWLKDNNPDSLKDALLQASYYMLPNVVSYLLERGCDPNIQDINGNTFVHTALLHNMKNLLPILEKWGDRIDYNIVNYSNKNMADYANIGGNQEYINYINNIISPPSDNIIVNTEPDIIPAPKKKKRRAKDNLHREKRRKKNNNNKDVINIDQ